MDVYNVVEIAQIRLTHVLVSVILAENATEEHKAACCAWTSTGLQSFDMESFAKELHCMN